MANKLKIYACSGIGQAEDSASFDYWYNNTNVLQNTQAVNTLTAYINANQAKLRSKLLTDRTQRQDLLDEIDLYAVCLYYAQSYSGNQSELVNAGAAIGRMCADGAFVYGSLNNEERDKHLDELYAKADVLISDGDVSESNTEFMRWWKETVIDHDRVGLPVQDQSELSNSIHKAMSQVKRQGVGDLDWSKDENIGKYLTDAGNYFIYTYFTKKQLAKLPKIFTRKALYQMQIYNYCKSIYVNVYGSEKSMRKVIRTGIWDKFGVSPEDVCLDIVNGNYNRAKDAVGQLWLEAIVGIITALAPVLVALIPALFNYFSAKNVAKYMAVDESVVKDNVADGTDFDKLMNKSDNTMWYILGGGALLLTALMGSKR